MFVDIGFILSHGLWICMGMAAIGVTYGILALIRKLRKLEVLQTVFIIGVVIIGYSSLRDIFTYLNLNVDGFNLLLPPFGGTNFARVGVIGFLLCQAASIFIATMNEMEETKRQEQEAMDRERTKADENATLESLARMKTEYLANISHEIKTPLTVISGNVQEVAELFGELRVEDGVAIVDGETIHKSLKKAQNEILRLARITENVLRISAMQESREKMQTLDAAEFFTASAEMYRGVIQKNANTLKIHASENLPGIYGNADQLNQVVANLLSNANKHTSNGVIELRVERGEWKFVRVSVHDTGSGIAADILPEIFERGISDSNGTGMGLAICKNIIEAHGGTITILSSQCTMHNEESGTTVIFTIPIFKEENSVNEK